MCNLHTKQVSQAAAIALVLLPSLLFPCLSLDNPTHTRMTRVLIISTLFSSLHPDVAPPAHAHGSIAVLCGFQARF